MKTQFNFIDPGAIMGVVVALIILAVGVFAFYVTIGSIPFTSGQASMAINNTSNTGTQVFNIIGIVMIIGAIMSIFRSGVKDHMKGLSWLSLQLRPIKEVSL
jgi:mannose/fructose/N-acetylgalactosamine-specific phosphotransferase system component IID